MSTSQVEADFEDVPPDPIATIESLGSLGYSPQSAVADLIDNSISAGASHINVWMHWNGPDSWCAVVDDGSGMDEEALRQAMKIGSKDPLTLRNSSDLGRFGCGLKTASFSQARQLTVAARSIGTAPLVGRTWDLDHVRKSGRWELMTIIPKKTASIVEKIWIGGTGTAIVWRQLRGDLVEDGAKIDNSKAHKHFLSCIAAVERHLAMTFGRFLIDGSDRLQIQLNGNEIAGWDPFLADNPATQCRPREQLQLGKLSVTVAPYVLPHASKLTKEAFEVSGGPSGWNEQQGFYIYRRDRLIQAGGWLTLRLSRDDNHNLARISIDVPAEMDHLWHLDIKKASVRPPAALVEDLRRIAVDTRRVASAVYRHRGAVSGRSTSDLPIEPIWIQVRKHGDFTFRISRKHPLIDEFLKFADGNRKFALDVLRLIEITVPRIRSSLGGQVEEPPYVDDQAMEMIRELAYRTYESLLQKGLNRTAAKKKLAQIEPFNIYPEVIEKVVGGE